MVCTNGLVVYKEETKSKFRHLNGSLDKLSLEGQIKKDMIGFSEQNNIWNKWAETQLESIEVMEVIDMFPFSDKEKEKLVEIPLLNHDGASLGHIMKSGKASLWAINSAATQFAKHAVKSEHRALNLETEISEILGRFRN